MCAGAGPGKHCVKNPSPFRCNLLMHGFPPNCPEPVKQPLQRQTNCALEVCDEKDIVHTSVVHFREDASEREMSKLVIVWSKNQGISDMIKWLPNTNTF